MSKKLKVEHLDILGKEIAIDDVVAFGLSNNLKIGKVTKINPKMIKVKIFNNLNSRWRGSNEYNKYPTDVVVIAGQDAMLYILKNS